MEKIARQAGKITGELRDLTHVCTERIFKKANEILNNESHVLHMHYQYLRSGKRLKTLKCRTERYRKSFVPLSVRVLNDKT